MDYIRFDFQDHKFTAKVHIKNKDILIDNPFLIKKLIQTCKQHGFIINRKGILKEEVEEIYKEYHKAVRHAIKVKIFQKIDSKMKLSKENKLAGKIAVASTIATIAIATGVNALAYVPDESNSHENIIIEALEEEIPTEIPAKGITAVFEEEIYPTALPIRNYSHKIEEKKEEVIEEEKPTYEFHYSYDGEGEKIKLENAKRYEDVMEKYASRYGLDKNILIAMAAQETGGDHYNHIDSGPACGIMQIERIHIGSTITGYNFETKENESITITLDTLQDLEGNIKVGSIILQNAFERNHYNIPLALQEYNMGMGNLDSVLNRCSSHDNISKDLLRENPEENQWLEHRSYIGAGDPNYIEHVFQYLEGDCLIFETRDNEKITYQIINDQKNNITKK